MKNILVTLFSLILFCSCTRYITPPVTGQNNIGYIPRPFYKDSASSKISVSGGYETATSQDNHLDFYMANINLNRGHSFKNLNFGYGIFANFGKAIYRDTSKSRYYNDPPIANFNKNLNNIGFRTTLGYQFLSQNKKLNFRAINWESAFSVENGEYLNFRESLYNSKISGSTKEIYVTNQKNFFTTGLSTELLKSDAFGVKDLASSLRFFIGGTFDVRNKYRNISNSTSEITIKGGCVNVSYYLNYRKLFGSIELGTDVNSGAKFLLGYSF